ncbi:hypothetical protein CHU92_00195 [Flavobacterium cyanobacteriorum]|uniref:TreTu toxin C-terminal domain-containing protein n=1 Tax=Flavobacterium cyanobacteriorum TaxID=2022802 RepID=A0A256A9Y6_9FLAO|nr:hypothetical protein CHU92_00195 [Flavobacterium cyanobacteriorum]
MDNGGSGGSDGDPPNKRKRGYKPSGISEEESLREIIDIDGKKYHKNTGNIFAEIGNKINSFFGGDDDYFVEHKPYNPAEENAIRETINTGASFIVGGIVVKGLGKVGGALLSKIAPKVGMTTVGRWMSLAEYETMQTTGQMVEGAGGQTFVSTSGPNSFSAAVKGSVYAEFQVPTNSLLKGGAEGWFKTIGPNAGKAMQTQLVKQGGQQLPKIQNLSPILKVK